MKLSLNKAIQDASIARQKSEKLEEKHEALNLFIIELSDALLKKDTELDGNWQHESFRERVEKVKGNAVALLEASDE